jgi:hypothetical protein
MAEMVIQQLLLEVGAEGVDPDLVSVEPTGFEVGADWRTLRTPETYLAFGRSTGFASPDPARLNEPHAYPEPSRLGLNEWAPSGAWTLAQHAAVSSDAGARIAFEFQARDVNLVMGPPAHGTSVPFRVLLDGKTPDQRLHQLVRQPGSVHESRFEIEFLAAGAEAYCFTFG